MNRCIAKLTGIAIPQHDSGHATTAALKRGACEPAPSDAGSIRGVRRPVGSVAKEALALGIRRVKLYKSYLLVLLVRYPSVALPRTAAAVIRMYIRMYPLKGVLFGCTIRMYYSDTTRMTLYYSDVLFGCTIRMYYSDGTTLQIDA